MNVFRSLSAISVALVTSAGSVSGQQVVDTAFVARVRSAPAYASARGPVVMIDEAHHNFHTAAGRYQPFARLVTSDGFVIRSNTARFDSTSLAAARVLVIANAVAEKNQAQAAWRLPVYPAFERDEITAVVAWVKRGGSLLLIADHMPFAGAADSLASALGVYFANGFAIPPFGPDPRTGDYPIVFRRSDGSLARHAVTGGRSSPERIDSIVSFTGSAFRLGNSPASRIELMRLPSETRVKLPMVAWQFSDSTAEIRGDDLLQGALLRVGRGRVGVFGEAAMFSAQYKGPGRTPMGMNAPEAGQNPQFILNLLHWLVLPPSLP